ncbi:MAG: hypothetical protein K940chlam7_00401 [Chlamydiae bacterium]|nr:hypothetical protein [Chlamydiota bacterium]
MVHTSITQYYLALHVHTPPYEVIVSLEEKWDKVTQACVRVFAKLEAAKVESRGLFFWSVNRELQHLSSVHFDDILYNQKIVNRIAGELQRLFSFVYQMGDDIGISHSFRHVLDDIEDFQISRLYMDRKEEIVDPELNAEIAKRLTEKCQRHLRKVTEECIALQEKMCAASDSIERCSAAKGDQKVRYDANIDKSGLPKKQRLTLERDRAQTELDLENAIEVSKRKCGSMKNELREMKRRLVGIEKDLSYVTQLRKDCNPPESCKGEAVASPVVDMRPQPDLNEVFDPDAIKILFQLFTGSPKQALRTFRRILETCLWEKIDETSLHMVLMPVIHIVRQVVYPYSKAVEKTFSFLEKCFSVPPTEVELLKQMDESNMLTTNSFLLECVQMSGGKKVPNLGSILQVYHYLPEEPKKEFIRRCLSSYCCDFVEEVVKSCTIPNPVGLQALNIWLKVLLLKVESLHDVTFLYYYLGRVEEKRKNKPSAMQLYFKAVEGEGMHVSKAYYKMALLHVPPRNIEDGGWIKSHLRQAVCCYDDRLSLRLHQWRKLGGKRNLLQKISGLFDVVCSEESCFVKARDCMQFGKQLVLDGKYLEAIEWLEKSLALDPRLWETHFDLGLIYEQQNRSGKARDHYQRATMYFYQFQQALGISETDNGAYRELLFGSVEGMMKKFDVRCEIFTHNIVIQLERARELLNELQVSLRKLNHQSDATLEAVTRNVRQELLVKMRHILDQMMWVFYQKRVGEEIMELYFPVKLTSKDKEHSLKSAENKVDEFLKNARIKRDFKRYLGPFYEFLCYLQPIYNKNYRWLGFLAERAGKDKHEKITPQVPVFKINPDMTFNTGLGFIPSKAALSSTELPPVQEIAEACEEALIGVEELVDDIAAFTYGWVSKRAFIMLTKGDVKQSERIWQRLVQLKCIDEQCHFSEDSFESGCRAFLKEEAFEGVPVEDVVSIIRDIRNNKDQKINQSL